MRGLTLLILSSFVAVPGALACPDLQGTYLCRENSFRRDTLYTYRQSLTPEGWVFGMLAQPVGESLASDLEFLADGVKREIADRVSGRRLLVEASCNSTELAVTGETRVGPTLIRFSETLSIDPQGNLSNLSLDINGNEVRETCLRY